MRAGLSQQDERANCRADRSGADAPRFAAKAVAGCATSIPRRQSAPSLSGSRAAASRSADHAQSHPTLAMVREFTAKHSGWVLIGSAALKTDDDRQAALPTESFLI